MTELKEKFFVPAPPDEVWPLMSDPAVVAACIPGAELTEMTADGAHRGKVTFKFGPTVAVFRGETRLTYDHPVKRCLIEARGIDQKGASRARARFEVQAYGADALRRMVRKPETSGQPSKSGPGGQPYPAVRTRHLGLRRPLRSL